MSGIFISYRREDTGDFWAKSAAGVLGREFGGHRVFFDIASITKGKDFRREIRKFIEDADVVLVIIGRDFFALNRETGERRIDERDDPVRIEVKMALEKDKPTIPVLTDGTKLIAEEFPEDIRSLAFHEKVELRTRDNLDALVGAVTNHVRGGPNIFKLSTGKSILDGALDQHLVHTKVRTALTEQLIKMGWMLDDRYGQGALSHQEFLGFRLRFERDNELLVLESMSDVTAKRPKWKPVTVFLLTNSISEGTGYITLPDQIRPAATNPRKILEQNGFMSRWRYRKALKVRLPTPLPLPAMVEGPSVTEKRRKAHDSRHRISPKLKVEEVGRLLPNAGRVKAIVFHPELRLLAVGTGYGQIQLWNIDNPGSQPTVLEGHEKPVQCMAFAGDGRLASGATDGVIKIWDTGHGTEVQKFRRGALHRLFNQWEDSIKSLSWSPDGKWLASSSWEKAIRLWNTKAKEPPRSIRHERSYLDTAVAFHPDGHTLIVGGLKSIARYDVSTGSSQQWPRCGDVKALEFSPDGRIVATACGEGMIYLHDASDGSRVATLAGHEPAGAATFANNVKDVAFSPNGRWLVSIAGDNRLIFWDLQHRQISNVLDWESDYSIGPGGPLLTWSPDGGLIALPTKGGEVHILAVKELPTQKLGQALLGRKRVSLPFRIPRH